MTPALLRAAETYRPSIKNPGCFSFMERLSVCLGVFPVNPPFSFRTLSRILKGTVSAFHISAAADGGRASAERTAEIKRAETKLWANLISAVEALCTAGIQEAQHLNRASEKVDGESG